jgi:hypothetical protein
MELKQFIKESLGQILEGVSQAEREANYNGMSINPSFAHYTQPNAAKFIGENHKLPVDVIVDIEGRIIVMVDFDVAVTATEGTGTKGGIGVFVGAVGLGSQGQSTKANTSETRIKFRVPVILPHTWS